MMSKRVKRSGHGANGQNGVSGSGGIHGENGCRLANTMAMPYSTASACGSSVRCRPAASMSYASVFRTTVTFSCVASGSNPAARNIDSDPW